MMMITAVIVVVMVIVDDRKHDKTVENTVGRANQDRYTHKGKHSRYRICI